MPPSARLGLLQHNNVCEVYNKQVVEKMKQIMATLPKPQDLARELAQYADMEAMVSK